MPHPLDDHGASSRQPNAPHGDRSPRIIEYPDDLIVYDDVTDGAEVGGDIGEQRRERRCVWHGRAGNTDVTAGDIYASA